MYHKALVYCLGISDDTRRNIYSIYDFKTGRVSIKEKLAEKKAVIEHMVELARQVLGKLEAMSDEKFAEVALEAAE